MLDRWPAQTGGCGSTSATGASSSTRSAGAAKTTTREVRDDDQGTRDGGPRTTHDRSTAGTRLPRLARPAAHGQVVRAGRLHGAQGGGGRARRRPSEHLARGRRGQRRRRLGVRDRGAGPRRTHRARLAVRRPGPDHRPGPGDPADGHVHPHTRRHAAGPDPRSARRPPRPVPGHRGAGRARVGVRARRARRGGLLRYGNAAFRSCGCRRGRPRRRDRVLRRLGVRARGRDDGRGRGGGQDQRARRRPGGGDDGANARWHRQAGARQVPRAGRRRGPAALAGKPARLPAHLHRGRGPQRDRRPPAGRRVRHGRRGPGLRGRLSARLRPRSGGADRRARREHRLRASELGGRAAPGGAAAGGPRGLAGGGAVAGGRRGVRALQAQELAQLTALFTSALIFASSVAVNSFSAKEVGHMAPSSRFALSLKLNVAYLELNFLALWKKQTTLPSLAYAGIPYQVFGEREGALALTISWSRLAMARSCPCISAIFASTSLSPSALCARGPRRACAFSSWARSFIAARSSSVNPLEFLPVAAVLLVDFFALIVPSCAGSPISYFLGLRSIP